MPDLLLLILTQKTAELLAVTSGRGFYFYFYAQFSFFLRKSQEPKFPSGLSARIPLNTYAKSRNNPMYFAPSLGRSLPGGRIEPAARVASLEKILFLILKYLEKNIY